MQDVLAHEHLVGHAYHLVLAVFVEDDDVVDVGAVAHKLVFLQTRADETVGAVDVKLLVGLHHLRRHDGVEILDFGETRVVRAVLALDKLEPLHGDVDHVGQVVFYLVELGAYARHEFLGLVFVELQDAVHLDFHEAQYVVLGHLAYHLRVEGCEPLVHIGAGGVHVGSVLEGAALVDALLDENLLQRAEVQLFEQFAAPYLQFAAQQVHGVVYGVAQHVADGEKLRFVVLNHAAVGRDVHLAVGEGVEGVDGLVRRHARCQVHLHLGVGGRVVVHFLGLYLALVDGLENRLDECAGVLAEGNLAYHQRLIVEFLYLGAHFEHPAALAVVVAAHIDAAPRGEVGIEMEFLAAQVADGGVAYLVEVVRQNLGGEAHGDALGPLCQQQRELHRQRDRLLVAAVVA